MKPLTMTAEEEARFRAMFYTPGAAGRNWPMDAVKVAVRFITEIDAQRRLPVLGSTLDCGYRGENTCCHPRRARVTCDTSDVPTICPLRGSR